jgi:hypothetical protein
MSAVNFSLRNPSWEILERSAVDFSVRNPSWEILENEYS